MNKQMLYIITGLPYSGKSTLTKELIKRFNFSVVSIDKIMNMNNMWRKGHPTMKDWNDAYTEGFNALNVLLKNGKTVIWDGGCLKYSERENLRNTAQNLKVDSKLIYVNTSIKEVIERKNKNEVTKKRGQLDEKTMQIALNMFEEPKDEEEHLIYNSKVNLIKWIENNINKSNIII